MNGRFLGQVLLRKIRTFSDRLDTWLEMTDQSQVITAPMSYAERCFYLKVRHFLSGENLVVYDVGASIGDFSSMASKLRNVVQVYAFEPIPEIYDKLLRRMQRSPHAQCFNIALGDSRGMAEFYQSDYTPSSSLLPMGRLHRLEFPYTAHTTSRQVNVACLDDFVAERQLALPDFIKLDVQGFEDRVLRGGSRCLGHARHCVLEMSLVSLYEGSLLFDDLYQVMRDSGYRFVGFVDQVIGRSGQIVQVDGMFERGVIK